MSRTNSIQQIYSRLSSLEDQREEARLKDESVSLIDEEMKALRQKLQVIMNSPCPVVKECCCGEEETN